ncbi:hypothetical protein [Sporomusa sp. KB1]|jgi:hypothetical protein|uniref:hypothetical protein n=1 Tax=Sporomusa sp. KB1 TaxID=943346 RepID=UPI00119EDF9F|nr:hypothetical protein [Sporomusa sp. KB1]TWH47767.1 hypothetical protein Salpa_3853 [Sporomusa sp. KB1]
MKKETKGETGTKKASHSTNDSGKKNSSSSSSSVRKKIDAQLEYSKIIQKDSGRNGCYRVSPPRDRPTASEDDTKGKVNE